MGATDERSERDRRFSAICQRLRALVSAKRLTPLTEYDIGCIAFLILNEAPIPTSASEPVRV